MFNSVFVDSALTELIQHFLKYLRRLLSQSFLLAAFVFFANFCILNFEMFCFTCEMGASSLSSIMAMMYLEWSVRNCWDLAVWETDDVFKENINKCLALVFNIVMY